MNGSALRRRSAARLTRVVLKMDVPRISASSYSNTAPLIWSFLYGSNHGKVELILDNAPARSAELLMQGRVDAALVPVFAYQHIENAKLIAGVCVGAAEKVRSVCLVTRGMDLEQVRSVALDTSSRTSAALTKIIFREFFNSEPEWKDSKPDLEAMLDRSDAALLIGDPALVLPEPPNSGEVSLRKFDIAELWRAHTGLGLVFAMWMTTKDSCAIDFAAARDEGLEHVEEIISNYRPEIALDREDFKTYLSTNISYRISGTMQAGMELYFRLAEKHRLIKKNKPLTFV